MFDEAFRRDGHLVFERMFDPALVAAVHDAVVGRTGPIDPDRLPRHLKVSHRRYHMDAHLEGPLLDPALWANPLMLRVIETLFGHVNFLIDNIVTVTALPGAKVMRPHLDHPELFPGADDAAVPPFAITVAIPLVAIDEESGTTRLYSGSMGARWCEEEGRLDRACATVDPYVPLGGCFLMDYRLWHEGLANRSARERPFLYIIYARSWFTDTVNFLSHPRMTIAREALEAMPYKQRLLFRRAAAPGLVDAAFSELGAADEGDRPA